MDTHRLSTYVKQQATLLGFDACGIAAATVLDGEQASLHAWLSAGMHADMGYMARNVEKRLDPRLLVPNTRSIISLLISYKPMLEQDASLPQVARYAYGNDYHDTIREKLKLLLAAIQQQVPQCEGRGFTDSAPVLERAWAVRSGLGWIGKNGLLINELLGSYVFIAELLVSVELVYDEPFTQHLCGSCNRCRQACPNQAIVEPRVVDARKCISYQTIENGGVLSAPLHGQLFGCDRCQQACPWNLKALVKNHAEFAPIPALLTMDREEWESLTEQAFNTTFKHSPLMRTGYANIRRNLNGLEG